MNIVLNYLSNGLSNSIIQVFLSTCKLFKVSIRTNVLDRCRESASVGGPLEIVVIALASSSCEFSEE